MKKYCAAVMVLVLAAALMTGCGKTSSDEQVKAPEFEVSKINVNLKLDAEREEQEVLSYSDGKKMVFAIEAPNEIDYMTKWIAERFVVCDIANEKIETEYDLGKGVFGQSAIPYKDGLLYSCYRIDKENQQPMDWQVVYQTGKKRTVLVEGEREYGVLTTPEGDAVYYNYRNRDKWVVRKLEDDKSAPVAVIDGVENVNFLRIKADYCCICMQNNEDIIFSAVKGEKALWSQNLGLGGTIVSSINDAYILYYENGSRENGLSAINIKDGKIIKSNIALKEPSISSIGKYFLIQDDNKNQYYVKVEEGKIFLEKLEAQEGQSYGVPLDWGIPAGENGRIFYSKENLEDEMQYYLLKLK